MLQVLPFFLFCFSYKNLLWDFNGGFSYAARNILHWNAHIYAPVKSFEKQIYWPGKYFDQFWMLFFGHDPNRWLADEDEKEKESFDHVSASNDTKCQLKTKKKTCYSFFINNIVEKDKIKIFKKNPI